jgi:hypothetical protein
LLITTYQPQFITTLLFFRRNSYVLYDFIFYGVFSGEILVACVFFRGNFGCAVACVEV